MSVENQIAECEFCGRTLPIEAAVDEGWDPCHIAADGRESGCVCPECVVSRGLVWVDEWALIVHPSAAPKQLAAPTPNP